MPKTVDRLVVLGLDGATWTVLDPMRQRGLMPNLDALLADARRTGRCARSIPPVTTAAWTTMMTGCGPARHGVFDHRYYDAAAGRMKVNHSGRIRVPDRLAPALRQPAGRSSASTCPGLYPAARRSAGSSSRAWTRPTSTPRSRRRPSSPPGSRPRSPATACGYFWKRAPAVARRADRERPAHRRELPRPRRGRLARRRDASPTGRP